MLRLTSNHNFETRYQKYICIHCCVLFSITFHIKISETCCIDISKSFVGGGGPVDYQVHPRHAALLVQPGMIHYELCELWYILYWYDQVWYIINYMNYDTYMIYWYNQMIGHKLGRTFQVSISNFLLVFEIFCSLHWYHLRPHTQSLSLFLSLSLSLFLHREAQKARVWYSSTPTFLSSANLIRDITQFST